MAQVLDNRFNSIPFSEIMGEEDGPFSMEKVEKFLDRFAKMAAKDAEVSPNQLVRVIRGTTVTWMTKQQAQEYLELGQDHELQQEVEQALKADLKFIRQELEILLALAVYTFNQFKSNNSLTPADIDRIEPSLRRRKIEINTGIAHTRECELRMRERRRQNPILDEYEALMGEFLNYQNRSTTLISKERERVHEVATLLKVYKRKYLLLAKALEPDLHTVYQQRMNLQKTKRRILNTQNELISSRSNMLNIEIGVLQEHLSIISEEVKQAEKEGEQQAALTIERSIMYASESTQMKIEQKQNELEVLQLEKKAVEKQEAKVDRVVDHISTQVLREQDNEVPSNKINQPAPNVEIHDPNLQDIKKRASGMHLERNRA